MNVVSYNQHPNTNNQSPTIMKKIFILLFAFAATQALSQKKNIADKAVFLENISWRIGQVFNSIPRFD